MTLTDLGLSTTAQEICALKSNAMNKRFYYYIFQISIFLLISCNWISGEYPLGSNLSLWDNDKEKTAIIVYCEGNCHGGIQVLPTRESQTNNGEYVEEAIANKQWAIAKTNMLKNNKESFYIISKNFDIKGLDCSRINCDSILQSHIVGPMDKEGFVNKKKSLNIDLDFR